MKAGLVYRLRERRRSDGVMGFSLSSLDCVPDGANFTQRPGRFSEGDSLRRDTVCAGAKTAEFGLSETGKSDFEGTPALPGERQGAGNQ